MINLLPPDLKQTLRYADYNTRLMRLVVGLLFGVLGIIGVLGIGYFYLHQESNSYRATIRESELQLEKRNEKETIARVQDISSSLKLVVNVLSQEILFSKLIRQVGAQMPPNTVLQDLRLSNELSGALDLQVGASSYDAASQVQVNLMNSRNNIFDKADLISVTCGQSSDSNGGSAYPCQATLRAIFNKDNDFTLLNSTAKGGER